MALLFRRPRARQPQQLVGANPYWVKRGLRSLYALSPGVWNINQVTGEVGGAQVGTGISFVGGKLRTPGTTGNGATLEHGLALNVALPITLVVGWKTISGTVAWSILTSTTNWFGWYGQATGDIKTSNNNSFDGLLTLGTGGSYAFTHDSATSLRGASSLGIVTDATATAPTSINVSTVTLGYGTTAPAGNPAVSDWTHFAALQGSLTNAELLSLQANPGQLWASETSRVWVPVSAGGVSLAADAAAQASASAELLKGVSLAGAALGVASGTAGLALSVPLAATATGQATASGQIALSINFAAGALATASATAALALEKPLAAAAAAQATGTAALDVAPAGGGVVNLSAAALGQASSSASLSLAVNLSAAALGQASSAATLWLQVPLSAAALAQAAAGGALSLTVNLSAAALGQSSASASLPSVIALSAAGVAIASAGATLQVMGSIDPLVNRMLTVRQRARRWVAPVSVRPYQAMQRPRTFTL